MHTLIDSHCHLDAAEFDGDREAVVQRASQAGLGTLIVPAVERANFGAVASVCREFPICRPAYGIHPLYADRAESVDLQTLRARLLEDGGVALGEIGLDFYVDGIDRQRQLSFFTDQLKLAAELGLPVLLHVRRAVDEVLTQLRRTRVLGGIAHAFNGSRQQADQFIALGFKLGFGGAMTHPRATRLRELAATLPLEAIVLETDAPDIPPHWLNGGRNEPAELPRIALELARLRGISVDSVLAATSANVAEALPRLSDPSPQPETLPAASRQVLNRLPGRG